jgi:hypothetical protein
MVERNALVLALALAVMGAVSGVGAAGLDGKYLAGKWEINTDGHCGGKDAEYIVFRNNGTFENGRSGKAESVGFWGIEDDVLRLHMISSPAYFADIAQELKSYEGAYGYFLVKAVTFDMQKDSFGAVAVLGEQMNKLSAVRCK